VPTKVCNRCGEHNPQNAQKCKACGKASFAPLFVRERKRINQAVTVDIVESHPDFPPVRLQVQLNRFWKGDATKFSITNEKQWGDILAAVEALAPAAGWKPSAVTKRLMVAPKGIGSLPSSERTVDLAQVLERDVDLSGIAPDDYQKFVALVKSLSAVFKTVDAGFAAAFSKVVAKLPSQRQQALQELSELLESWSLHQLTGVTREVTSRVATISLFKQRIEDDATYEIRGDNSIHRILENAMWLLDDRYWLLQSNSSLRTLIGDRVVKLNKGDASKRPDFVCGSVDKKLIIVEIKRPGHKLNVDDLNQLEEYFAIAEKLTDLGNYEGYLVGREISDDLRARMKFRGRGFNIQLYADLVASTERRYKDYLKFLGKAKDTPSGT
jgi:hypothetical protein